MNRLGRTMGGQSEFFCVEGTFEIEVEADTGTVYCGGLSSLLINFNVDVMLWLCRNPAMRLFSIAVASTDNDTLRPLDRCAGCL